MAEQAELGPLDVQLYDEDRERRTTALDDVQSLNRLNAAALEMFDSTMFLLVQRTGKRQDTIIPHALHYVADLMRPLFENINVSQYSERSRLLKVAEEYAIRLLEGHAPPPVARRIARSLVENYPEHAFVIDSVEAKKIGLNAALPTEAQAQILDQLEPYLETQTIFGRVEAK